VKFDFSFVYIGVILKGKKTGKVVPVL